MKININLLKTLPLFREISVSDLEKMLECIDARIKTVKKDEILLLSGSKPLYMGIVLDGQLQIAREDYDGNRSLIAPVTVGDVYGETLCCAGILESPVTVTAGTDASVLLLRFSRILHTCQNSCAFHTKLVENMLGIIAGKNLFLQLRMEIISMKSVRAKVLRYFDSFSPKRGRQFLLPFNREEMADYLCVERSALSHELSRMKKDGLIEYSKNKFVLLR